MGPTGAAESGQGGPLRAVEGHAVGGRLAAPPALPVTAQSLPRMISNQIMQPDKTSPPCPDACCLHVIFLCLLKLAPLPIVLSNVSGINSLRNLT